MRKLLTYLAVMVLLCGCSPLRTDNYVAVEPHNEGYEVAIDSSAVTVSSYLGLKNAMTDMVEKWVTDGVIRAEGYSGELTEDLDNAVYEVWRVDPLGAYGVDYMTYDCAKIVSYYEIHVHITYRRTEEEMASVVYASNLEELKARMQDAMEVYAPVLRVQVSDYEDLDYKELTREIYETHPEFALEMPKTTVSTYPENGSQRILEFSYDYDTDQQTMMEMRDQGATAVENITKLYGSSNDEMLSVRRFYNRVIRDGVLVNGQDSSAAMPDSVYGVLVAEAATSYGYAQTYALLLRNKDIPCVVLPVNFMNETRYLCMVTLEDGEYYVDLAQGVIGSLGDSFLMTEGELLYLGYSFLEP